MKRLLVICPYPPDSAGSQRFRYELYLPELQRRGIQVDIAPFWEQSDWEQLYLQGKTLAKLWGFCKAWLRRFYLLFSLGNYQMAIIHREASPIGPPWLEWVLARWCKIPFIYDFDDAIWLTDRSEESGFMRVIRARWKVAYLCRWATVVTPGNEYLAEFASWENKQLFLLPTAVDTSRFTPVRKQNNIPVVGWTGTHSTLRYIEGLLPVLNAVYSQHPFQLLVVCNTVPTFSFPNMRFVTWTKHREVDDLHEMDLGLMPLPDEPWTRGKCGFKAIQYMSVGIPAIASPVGVNCQIIHSGQNGFLADSHEEWVMSITRLIENEELRLEMGKAARQSIEKSYSLSANLPLFMAAVDRLQTN